MLLRKRAFGWQAPRKALTKTFLYPIRMVGASCLEVALGREFPAAFVPIALLQYCIGLNLLAPAGVSSVLNFSLGWIYQLCTGGCSNYPSALPYITCLNVPQAGMETEAAQVTPGRRCHGNPAQAQLNLEKDTMLIML